MLVRAETLEIVDRASCKAPEPGTEARVEGRPESLTVSSNGTRSVSCLWRRGQNARACFVLGHGAGAGMTHPILEAVADGLAEGGVATLRYQFPFMQQGSR